MLNKVWRWFKGLFCRHEWFPEGIVIRHLQFYSLRRCVVCGKLQFKRYKTEACPYCGWHYRLKSVGTDGDDGYLYQKVCVNNDCPNFMGESDDPK